MQTLWSQRFAQRTQRMTSSMIRELLKFTEQPDMISFAGGMPAPELFPLDEVVAAAERVLHTNGKQALQYSSTEGYRPLRDMIARHTERFGLRVSADNIMITSGSQQALDLLGKIFINPGDRILVEAPTYLGALQAWNVYGAEYVPVPVDEGGMIVSALEAALRSGPKFIYALPNFQNPAGVTLRADRRRRLVALADRYGVPIVEDDPYGQLRFEGTPLTPLVVLDGRDHEMGDFCYRGNVIYLSTFSKILAPGLRLAWVVAPPEVIDKLVQAKQGSDLNTALLNQMLVYEVAQGGFLDRHISRLQTVYRQRRDTMLQAMAEHFPEGVQWTHPEGGLFLWVTLPEGLDSSQVLAAALQHKVACVPGAPFYPCGGGANTLRLNFSYSSPELIHEGIARLGQVLQEQMLGTPHPVRMPAEPVAV
jgi:2-aminoadipate transaminase